MNVIKAILITVLFTGTFITGVFGQSDSTTSAPAKRERKPFIKFYILKNASYLYLWPRVGVFVYHEPILGDLAIEDQGIRFTPYVESPENYPDDLFQKYFWYNSLFNEIFIPYSEIKKYGLYGVIKKKNGSKIKVMTREHKELKAAIRSHITK